MLDPDSLTGASILVVEDDPDTLELFAVSLMKLGADVRRAGNAAAALAQLATWRPDAVLCDLHLPGVDGYTLLEAIHADPAYYDLPVIAISGSHASVERERSLHAGFASHLEKPTKLGVIAETMLECIHAVRPRA